MDRANKRLKATGFTIVELLIVVVVIAILAAVAIVAYSGIRSQAADAVVRSDLQSAAQHLEKLKIMSANQQYPADLVAAALPFSQTVTYQYTYTQASNDYCLTAVPSLSGVSVYRIESVAMGTIKTGACSGHTVGGPPVFTTLTWSLLPGTAAMTTGGGYIAMSGDGNKIAICSDYVYISEDRGQTWTNTGLAKKGAYNMMSCDMSRDGQVIMTGHYSGAVAVSTNGGASWVNQSRSAPYVGVSGDGSVWAAFDRYGAYLSEDNGATWALQSGITALQTIRFVSLSYDGSTIITGGDSTVGLWCSADGGTTWTRPVTTGRVYTDAVVSDDGTAIYVTNRSSGYLNKTLTACTGWSIQTLSNPYKFSSIAASSDLSKIVAANLWASDSGPNVTTSTDNTVTWTINTTVSAGTRYSDVASSVDGAVIALLVDGAGLYIGTYGP